MKKPILFTGLLFVIAFSGISAAAQCDPPISSPIRCGYYTEGHQDGAADARNNQSNNYRRYSNKYERKYEREYSQGYNVGFDGERPTTRWTNSQRTAYDSGYTLGQNDRRRGGQNRSAEQSMGQYDQNIGLYFQQGYYDGFGDRPRQYDVPLGNYPPNPGGGGTTGMASWNGRVDDRANIVIRGGTLTAETVSGNGVQTISQNMNGVLPRRSNLITARKLEGRGDVTVFQQPSRSNDFTAIVQIYDRQGGAGNYNVEISWGGAGGNTEESYRPGSVTWRGRVDQTANISISGSDVQSDDASGSGLSDVSFNINGSLARRPGSVNIRKRNGRGTVTVLQQPSWDNNFTAIVQVFDPGGGADNYEVEITW